MDSIYKRILNHTAGKTSVLKELSPKESSALKKCLLDIYINISQVCSEHGWIVMLGGGSCLGAIRHQGFIPWDDDLDLLMPRKDYDCFIHLCEEGALGEDFFISYPNGKKDSETMFLKVFMRGTMMKGLVDDSSIYPRECFVDIFPIEGMPKNLIVRKIKGFLANSIRLIANTVLEFSNRSSVGNAFYSSTFSLRLFRSFRMALGCCFSVISHKTWVCWYDNFVRNPHSDGSVGIPTGRKLYDGETFPSSVFFPCSQGLFEGIKVYLPANADRYLTNLYHHYMQMPSLEKRERHFFTEFSVPQKYYEQIKQD